MIGDIIRLIISEEHFNVSKEIEIVKGKYQYVDTLKKFKRQTKRILHSKA